MSVTRLIEERVGDWRMLANDVTWLRRSASGRLDPTRVADFARRYRAACSDLALASALRFPPETRDQLRQLVGAAHTQFYQSESFSLLAWLRSLAVGVPRRIIIEPCFWISFAVFWSIFVGSLGAAASRPGFAAEVVGEATLAIMEEMYAEKPGLRATADNRSAMTGYYVFNNAGIGLRCFASGIFCGLGSLLVLAFNALFLGTIFGHMLVSPHAANFQDFVTAHGPFELMAVVLAATAGLRLGWSMLDTRGTGRIASLRRAAPEALEFAGLATVLFVLAAFIEGFVSPSELPYASKAGIAILTATLLLAYFVVPFLPGRDRR